MRLSLLGEQELWTGNCDKGDFFLSPATEVK